MITAYCIHTSEGIPVRRIMETKPEGNVINVTVAECDWDWNRKSKVQTFKIAVKSQPWYVRTKDYADWYIREMTEYHKKFRRQMNHQHNWRFEVYWPLSSLVS